jgi:hypothetical protein
MSLILRVLDFDVRVVTAINTTNCAGCAKTINVGEKIVNPGFGKWCHVRCARAVLQLPNPGDMGIGQDDEADGSNMGEVRLRRAGTSDRREAASLTELYPDAFERTETRSLQGPGRRKNALRSHRPWSDAERENVRWRVGLGHSARAIGRTYGRSMASIQTEIGRMYGPDSDEAKAYGTHDAPGPRAEWTDQDDQY